MTQFDKTFYFVSDIFIKNVRFVHFSCITIYRRSYKSAVLFANIRKKVYLCGAFR